MTKKRNTQLTLSEVKGPLNEINEMLSGRHGRRNLKLLNKFLRKEPVWVNRKHDWKIWKQISFNTKNVSDCFHLNSTVFENESVRSLLANAPLFSISGSIDLILVTPWEIGLCEETYYELDTIFGAAEEYGLTTFAKTYVIQLRIDYPEQQKQEEIICATEPENNGEKNILFAISGKANTITAVPGEWDTQYRADAKFVFAIEKK